MSAITRGAKNAVRNPLRTISVTAILGLSLGLVVVMLAARSAVDNRIAEVKRTVGNTVTISPAGARGFLGGGEPLTAAQLKTVAAVAHVTGVKATIEDQMNSDSTSLKSAIEAGSLGGRGARIFRGESGVVSGSASGSAAPTSITPPVFAIGTNTSNYGGEQVGSITSLKSGQMLSAESNDNVALVGTSLAEKNSLVVGSTFTAYSTTITVQGIFDAGNQFANNAVVFPLQTLQRLSAQTDAITSMIAQVDSVEHLAGTTSSIASTLGSAADVTSSEATVAASIEPLENIRTISMTSLIGAFIAASIITLLTMMMIVRERRREIAVLKAIGAGDRTIVTQFVSESIVMSLCGSVVGIILGFVLSNPMLKALLSSSSTSGTPTVGGGPGGAAPVRIAVGGFRAVQGAVRDLQAVVDWHLIVYVVLAAIVVAIVGSAFPAWLIGKVRPAEVLRSE
jgi:putative ABC transport system permease protein